MQQKLFSLFVCIGLLFSGSQSAKFPDDLQQCKYGDSECIKNTINDIFTRKSEGYSEINLVSLNPLEIKNIKIKQGTESPVNIDLNFKDSKIFGIDTLRASKVIGFEKDLAQKHEIHFKGDIVTLFGGYDIKGRILVLPISGSGVSNITMVNPNLKLTFYGKALEKNDKTYMQLKDTKLTFTITRMYMNLDNLFNGDKTLGDNMNLFLNENWQDIFNEVKGSISEAFALIFESVINNVFLKFPYEDLFTKE